MRELSSQFGDSQSVKNWRESVGFLLKMSISSISLQEFFFSESDFIFILGSLGASSQLYNMPRKGKKLRT